MEEHFAADAVEEHNSPLALCLVHRLDGIVDERAHTVLLVSCAGQLARVPAARWSLSVIRSLVDTIRASARAMTGSAVCCWASCATVLIVASGFRSSWEAFAATGNERRHRTRAVKERIQGDSDRPGLVVGRCDWHADGQVVDIQLVGCCDDVVQRPQGSAGDHPAQHPPAAVKGRITTAEHNQKG